MTLKIIQELTAIVSGIHGTPVITQPIHPNDQPKTPGGKKEPMDIDKDNHKRKEFQTPRIGHRKTRATANIE